MRVLLDTNIVLDYLGANEGFTDDAEKVFDLHVFERCFRGFFLIRVSGDHCSTSASKGSICTRPWMLRTRDTILFVARGV